MTIPYTLGEIFAVYETALKSLKAYEHVDIRGKYFETASMTPSVGLPLISRLYHDSVKSFSPVKKNYYEKMLAELHSVLGEEFPEHLTLEQRSEFDLGYYQRFAALQNSKA